MDEEAIFKYLGENPDLLEKYILSSHVSQELFDRWSSLRRESSRGASGRGSWAVSLSVSRGVR